MPMSLTAAGLSGLMLISSPAGSASPLLVDRLQDVLCRSKSLTICQDEFCFVMFDGPRSDMTMQLDLNANTYRVPDIREGSDPMRVRDIERSDTHHEIKFEITLANNRNANADFLANDLTGHDLHMSAAITYVAPKSDQRSALRMTTAFVCGRD